jgi:hypothetical protein
MEQKQFKLSEHLEVAVSKCNCQQRLLGSTLTREYQYYGGDSRYKGVKYYRCEYEFDMWLVYFGLHIVFRPRLKKCGERK